MAEFNMKKGKYWNNGDASFYDSTISEFGSEECAFEIGQRSILNAILTMSDEEMIKHPDKNIRAIISTLKKRLYK